MTAPSVSLAAAAQERAELISALCSAASMADFLDPSRGQIARDISIEVNIGTNELVDSIMRHVRRSDAAIALIAEILDRLNRRALDIPTGDMSDRAPAIASLAAWRVYRDQVVNPPTSAWRLDVDADPGMQLADAVDPLPHRAQRFGWRNLRGVGRGTAWDASAYVATAPAERRDALGKLRQ